MSRCLSSLTVLAVAVALAGCASINQKLQGDKVDYKSTGGKAVSLDVPPDLSQLSRDSRYQPVGGAISASTLQTAAAAGTAPGTAADGRVAPRAVGEVRLERAGNQRWLKTSQTPEQLWPQLQAFWAERGFQLEIDQSENGLMETNWNENRVKLPQDFIRNTIGRLFDGLYDSGERDSYRTRLERSADGGTEVYISHRGMVEVYTGGPVKDQTAWQPRPADPELEAVMLTKLMNHLGASQEQVQVAAATAGAGPVQAPRARLLGAGAGVQVDDGFDRAWRRVGLALDRSGFTVEDRDRSQGVYYVRYVAPQQPGKTEERGFFSRLFGLEDKKEGGDKPVRYRIAVEGQADRTLVRVQDQQGAPETGPTAQRILELLVADLR